MLKKERQLADEDEIEITLEEKKLEEEERRLARLRDELGKSKQLQRDELEKLADQKRTQRMMNEVELQKQKALEREAKELLTVEQ